MDPVGWAQPPALNPRSVTKTIHPSLDGILGIRPGRRKLSPGRIIHVLLSAGGLVLLASPLAAHEGWLAPESFQVAAGGSVLLRMGT